MTMFIIILGSVLIVVFLLKIKIIYLNSNHYTAKLIIVEILLKLYIVKTPDESLKITTKPNQIDDGRIKLKERNKTMKKQN